MTEENKTQEAAENPEPEQQPAPAKKQADPVRRWTFIILVLCAVLFAAYLRSDRVTPYTTQARVNALVVPIASEVSGRVTSVSVSRSSTRSPSVRFTSSTHPDPISFKTTPGAVGSTVHARETVGSVSLCQLAKCRRR